MTENAAAKDLDVPASVTVIPPQDIRDVIEKTVGYIIRSGTGFMERLQDQKESKFRFLFKGDAYYPYYEWRLKEHQSGNVGNIGSSASASAGVSNGTHETVNGDASKTAPSVMKSSAVIPADLEFSHNMPPMSAQDLDIIKLAALYAAANGKQFVVGLQHRENKNFQYGFLNRGHSLHPLFQDLTDQYRKIIQYPKSSNVLKTRIETGLKNRYDVLERARIRAEYLAEKADKERLAEEEAEKERISYAQIDWHDFVVVKTIEFTQADLDVQLPVPLTLSQLQFASLEQKKAGIYSIEEAPPDYEPGPEPEPGTTKSTAIPEPESVDQPSSDNSSPVPTIPTGPSADKATPGSKPPGMKIRPAGATRLNKIRAGAEKMIKSPFTGQLIPESKFEDHKRAMMMDPKWKDQKALEEQRQSSTNLSTAEVEQNLKRLVNKRSNNSELTPEEMDRQKRAATEVQWDGRYSSREQVKEETRKQLPEQRAEYNRKLKEQHQLGPERSAK